MNIQWEDMTGKGTPNSGRLWWGWGYTKNNNRVKVANFENTFEIPTKETSGVGLSIYSWTENAKGMDVTDIVSNVNGNMQNPVDLVAFPKSEAHIESLFKFCGENRIACIPFGGGSSVVWGVNPPPDSYGFKGTITIDMIYFNRVLNIDKESLSARVQGGVYGPALEEFLKPHGLTLRYFPQSFEFSTFGGWLATRGGGHFATGPTHIDDMVESLRVVSPIGVTETLKLPASGAGPSEYRQYLGSEGIYGIITEGCVRIRERPSFRASATILFESSGAKDAFLKGANAVRKIAQSGINPANLRLVDGEEVATTTGRSGLENKAVLLVGFESAAKSDLDSEMDYVIGELTKAGGVLESTKGNSWTQSSSKGTREGISGEWGKGFMAGGYTFSESVLLGLLVNTFETSITWDRFPEFYTAINEKAEQVLNSVCGGGRITCRFTHIYPDGPAPYFTVVADGTTSPKDIRNEQWMKIKNAMTEVMIEYGAISTHHHAVGKLHVPHFEKERGALFEKSLRTLKALHDPNLILNPDVLIRHSKL